MKIRTILHEDEIQLTLTTNELTWWKVLLHCLLHDDSIDGWKDDIKRLSEHLDRISPEGYRMKRTTEESEQTDLEFVKIKQRG